MDIETVLNTLLRDGFILVFNQDKLDIVKTAEALLAAGIGNMEVTCRISKPLEKLARLRQELPAFVAGSAIFGTRDYKATIAAMRAALATVA